MAFFLGQCPFDCPGFISVCISNRLMLRTSDLPYVTFNCSKHRRSEYLCTNASTHGVYPKRGKKKKKIKKIKKRRRRGSQCASHPTLCIQVPKAPPSGPYYTCPYNNPSTPLLSQGSFKRSPQRPPSTPYTRSRTPQRPSSFPFPSPRHSSRASPPPSHRAPAPVPPCRHFQHPHHHRCRCRQ
ncbi:hypothetical protein VTK26DRAFT_821 [Humicola hyalothermophila]